jgi:hypothetical protein
MDKPFLWPVCTRTEFLQCNFFTDIRTGCNSGRKCCSRILEMEIHTYENVLKRNTNSIKLIIYSSSPIYHSSSNRFGENWLYCSNHKSPIRSIRNHTKKKKFHGLSPRANYTDRATAACRRSACQLLRIDSATWSA